MRKIHYFENQSDFEEYRENKYSEPWVSYTKSEERVNYNKTEDEKLGTPLTFEITGDGNILWKANNAALTKTIEYKLNDGEWTSITSNTGSSAPSISVVAGDTLQFRGNNSQYATSFSICNQFSSTVQFKIKGNIMSLINSTNFSGLTTLSGTYTFTCLFSNCTGLIDTSQLILPATTLTNYCYESMFQGCTSLTTAPKLPATTLANNCYNGMFAGCTSLTTAPSSIGTTATTMAASACTFMFDNCTSLTTAPKLPATTLAEYCYKGMFNNCTNLTTAPELPATTLANNCYDTMFAGCASLAQAPELPATTLASYCYANMFLVCTSLIQAPELPATTLTTGCYLHMFDNCSNLNYIKCLATDISASMCTNSWVSGVASSGTFVTPSTTAWSTGASGVPRGWTRVDA